MVFTVQWEGHDEQQVSEGEEESEAAGAGGTMGVAASEITGELEHKGQQAENEWSNMEERSHMENMHYFIMFNKSSNVNTSSSCLLPPYTIKSVVAFSPHLF